MRSSWLAQMHKMIIYICKKAKEPRQKRNLRVVFLKAIHSTPANFTNATKTGPPLCCCHGSTTLWSSTVSTPESWASLPTCLESSGQLVPWGESVDMSGQISTA